MGEPQLSASQRAYLFNRENFLAGLRQRAATLFACGYTLWPTATPHVFVVTCPHKDGEKSYFVNAVTHTCTCPFLTRQKEGEPLTEDGTLLACKHLLGLRTLLRQMVQALKTEGDLNCYYRLRAHWLGVLAEKHRQEHDDLDMADNPFLTCPPMENPDETL